MTDNIPLTAVSRQRLLAALVAGWLAIVCPAAQAQGPGLDLSDAERQWLADHPSIRLAVDIDWSPFEFINDETEYVGMAAEYTALVGQKLGINFEVEKNKPWPEMVEAVKRRELDMFSSVVDTLQRREYVDFTRPYLRFPMVIVTGDQVAYVNGLKDLKTETVAVVRGYATQDLLEKNHPQLTLYLADNVADALDKVSLGQVYAYIGNIATISDVIRREGLTNIKISGETEYSFDLSMAVRNDWPEFTPILQKALDSITEKERDQIYHNWIKLSYELGFDYQLLWKILIGVFLVVGFVLLWNRRLSNEIEKRTEAENQLKLTHQKLEQTNQELIDYVDIVDRYVITSSADRDGRIISVSEAFCTISGYSRDELIGNNHELIRHGDMPEAQIDEVRQALRQGKIWQGELKNRKKNGDHFWSRAYISPNFDEQGEVNGFTTIREDITDRKRAEALSITDELTGLFNRRHFNHLFAQELSRAERDRKIIGLMVIDVDYFKPYNDNYGHQQGDEALKQVASILDHCLRRAGDFAFRIGGEEFGVIVTAENNDDAFAVAEKLCKAVEDAKIEHAYSKISEFLTVSIGIEIHRGSGIIAANTELIFRLADDALYQAKENGRNRVVAVEIGQRLYGT